MDQLLASHQDDSLKEFRVYQLRVLMTTGSVIGWIYLAHGVSVAYFALYDPGMAMLTPALTQVQEKCMGSTNQVARYIGIYLEIIRYSVYIMLGTFAVVFWIKIISLLGFALCPLTKYRIQKCCLGHRYRKYEKGNGKAKHA